MQMNYGRNDFGGTIGADKKTTRLQQLVDRLDAVLRTIERNNTRLYVVIENADGTRPINEAILAEKAPIAPTTLSRLTDITVRFEGAAERMDVQTTDIEQLF